MSRKKNSSTPASLSSPVPVEPNGAVVVASVPTPRRNLLSLAMTCSVALAVGLVYLATAAPGAWWGDGQELACAAWTLGIPHPTGYPLYTLLGHICMKALHSVEPGRALTLFSTAAMAVAAGLSVRLFQRLIMGDPLAAGRGAACACGMADLLPAVGVGLVLAFSRTIWEQATFAEVYALNYLLAAVLLLLLWDPGADRMPVPHAIATGLTLGLMALNHYSFLAFLPLVGLVLLALGILSRASGCRSADRCLLLPPDAAGILLSPLSGRSQSAAQLGRSLHPRPVHLGAFRRAVPRVEAGHCRERRPSAITGWIGWWGFQLLPSRYAFPSLCALSGLVILGVAVVGLVRLTTARWDLGIGHLVALAATAAYAVLYRIPDIDAYFLPGVPAVAIGWIIAVRWGAERLAGRIPAFRVGPLYRMLPAVFAVAVLLWHFPVVDKSWDDGPSAWGEAVMESLPAESVVLTGGDADTYSLWYQQMVLGARQDIAVVGSNFIFSGWYAKYFEAANREKIPVEIQERAPGHKLNFDVALFGGTILPNMAEGRPLFATYADPLFHEYLSADPVRRLLPDSYYRQTSYPAPYLPSPVLYRLDVNPALQSLTREELRSEFEDWYRRQLPSR